MFQNLKAIGEELSEICVLFCKYIYIFIYIDFSPTLKCLLFGLFYFHPTTRLQAIKIIR
jgi:hypothetical protein